MDKNGLKEHVAELLLEKNYIGAYGHVRQLPDSDGLRIDLTGKIANAISEELSASRGQSPERAAYLRAQLAWVCRDVPGLSYLYREQTRSRLDSGFDLLKSIQDVAQGRPEDAADRVKRSVEDMQESIASGQAGDRLQDIVKDVERNMRDGVRQVGSFFDTMIRRGEDLRRQSEARRDGEERRPPDVKINIEKGEGPDPD